MRSCVGVSIIGKLKIAWLLSPHTFRRVFRSVVLRMKNASWEICANPSWGGRVQWVNIDIIALCVVGFEGGKVWDGFWKFKQIKRGKN